MKKLLLFSVSCAAALAANAKAFIPMYEGVYYEPLDIVIAFCGSATSPDSRAIDANGNCAWGGSVNFAGWASKVESYNPTNVPPIWRNTQNALGKATMTDTSEVVVLGDAGSITLSFGGSIYNGAGYDFVVFENALNDTFLEFGFVEVSTDGSHFVRFPNFYLGSEPVGPDNVEGGGVNDPTYVYNLGSKYSIGNGGGYDLEELKQVYDYIQSGGETFSSDYVSDFLSNYVFLDFNNIRYVRIVDVVGDGNTLDSSGTPIYDAYPTHGSPGFDLSGVAAVYLAAVPEPAKTALALSAAALALCAEARRRRK
ncbi:MAG: hypothetical protein J6P03_06595 [Opitutales bacterium]|nr:hypothetical protein [Opitutales bacterium]